MGPETFTGVSYFLVILIVLAVALVIANLVMWIVSWVHILGHKYYACGNRALWLILTFFFGFIASIFYFTLGKGYNINEDLI